MKRASCLAIGLLTCASLAAPQGEETEQAPATAKGLYKAYEAEFRLAYDAWRRPWLAARRRGDTKAATALEKQDPTGSFLPRFAAAAARYAGTEDAVPFLLWTLTHARYGRGDPSKPLATLIAAHIKSKQLERLPIVLALRVTREGADRTKALELQARIAAKNPHPEIATNALYWRSWIISETPGNAGEHKRAVADLKKALAIAGGQMPARCRSLLFEFEHLQIGMTAPEIEAEDIDGQVFRLTDYRGKVVMLSFWGDW
ncbi:MAG: hypothetical protein CMJ85_09760 [Planctomycetes bacterium]|jgi:hypothetical protein|nr:hypothetical protein [Planctomycetota bacterium]MDP6423895.1 redoxin domain-containing protein [Planctomycetota bacterium]